MPDAKKKTMGKYYCPTCISKEPETTRQVLHCGFMPREKWGGNFRLPVLGPTPYTADICPGYVARLPAVVEGREAYDAMETNTLHVYDPLSLVVVHRAAMLMKRSMGIRQQEQTEPGPGAR